MKSAQKKIKQGNEMESNGAGAKWDRVLGKTALRK